MSVALRLLLKTAGSHFVQKLGRLEFEAAMLQWLRRAITFIKRNYLPY